MRAPTTNERRLLIFLLAAVFVALNLAAFRMWLTINQSHRKNFQSATGAIADGQSWLLAAEAIGDVAGNIPPPPETPEKSAASSLLAGVRADASKAGLTVVEESLPPPPEGLPEKAAVLRLKLTGPFAGLVKFLFDLQKPAGWRSVEQMVVKADAKPQNILAELEIRQYYRPLAAGDGTPPPTQ